MPCPLNCGGVSRDMQHSELFDQVRGAITGASADRLGLFRAASGAPPDRLNGK